MSGSSELAAPADTKPLTNPFSEARTVFPTAARRAIYPWWLCVDLHHQGEILDRLELISYWPPWEHHYGLPFRPQVPSSTLATLLGSLCMDCTVYQVNPANLSLPRPMLVQLVREIASASATYMTVGAQYTN